MPPKKKLTSVEMEEGTPHADSAVMALEHVATSVAKFTEVFAASIELDKERAEISREKLNKLYEIVIEGNGKESMRAVLNRHEAQFAEINKLKWLVIAEIIGMVVGFGWLVINHLSAPIP